MLTARNVHDYTVSGELLLCFNLFESNVIVDKINQILTYIQKEGVEYMIPPKNNAVRT